MFVNSFQVILTPDLQVRKDAEVAPHSNEVGTNVEIHVVCLSVLSRT